MDNHPKNKNRAFHPADILLPKHAAFEKWACIACDQFTAEPEYWKKAEEYTKDAPSALHLVLPEIYLSSPDVENRIESINQNMETYLHDGVFEKLEYALLYIERTQPNGVIRSGVVGAVDLECYDYHAGASSLIRATEATVPDRLPPRVKIRSGAALELPHIMILIDDPDRSIIESFAAQKDVMEKLYAFDLMLGGGRIEGYLLPDDMKEKMMCRLDAFAERQRKNGESAADGVQPFVFAVGDGNHSLAAAKVYYEQLKAQNPEKDLSHHPARYALCELVNLHSPALEFEAIHRILTGVDKKDLQEAMIKSLGLSENEPSEQKITVVSGGVQTSFYIHKPTAALPVGSLQNFLDTYLSSHEGTIDYIHGADTVIKLSKREDAVGFLLPNMEKEQLLPTVAADGALPRKTFSMGCAKEKRYYIEARKIRE